MQTTSVQPARDTENRTSAPAKALRIVAGTLFLAALIAAGAIPRVLRHREALAAVRSTSIAHPVVSVIHPQSAPPVSELMLTGNIQPLYTAAVYARTDGYVEKRNVDIGTKVRAGEVLALISSPELDQQLLQARATVTQAEAALQQSKAGLEQAQANAELARLTKERDIPLGEEKAISRQIVDEVVQAYNARVADVAAAEANIGAAEANVNSNRANVQRLVQMQGFESVRAPFDGVVTERNVERGDLANAGSNGSAKPLFTVAQSETLRIQVDVPQSQAVNIHDGQKADLIVSERPGRAYTGTVIRSAASLDSTARTMRTEIEVDNRDGSLLPGMYAEVKFALSRGLPATIIPTSSLVIDRAGMHVVSVDGDNRLHFIKVEVGQDMGTQVEVIHGLSGKESLVANPNDLLSDGQLVEVR